jgi:AcrR family transcriptional regulator
VIVLSRQKILDAAVSVFSKSGYHKASMDEIASAAGVAKGTLYYNFPSKAELFKVLVTEGLDFIINEILKEIKLDLPADESLKKALDKNIDLYLQYNELFSIFLNEISSGLDEEIISEVTMLKNKYIKFIADLLKEGNKYGIITHANYEMAAAGIIGMLDSSCKYYLKNKEKYELTEVKNSMFNTIFYGLMAK